MNYFAELEVKVPLRRRRRCFCVLFNPPGALHLYGSEDSFYAGRAPLGSYSVGGAGVSAVNYDQALRQNYLILQCSGRRLFFYCPRREVDDLARFRDRLLAFCKISYQNVTVPVAGAPGAARLAHESVDAQAVKEVRQITNEA